MLCSIILFTLSLDNRGPHAPPIRRLPAFLSGLSCVMMAFPWSRPFPGGPYIAETAVAMCRTDSACRHHARWLETQLIAAERRGVLTELF